MKLHRLGLWFALPDAVRSLWKRRLVWGVLFVLVLAGVTAWVASRPVLNESVRLVEVSREDAVEILKTVRRARVEIGLSPGAALTFWNAGRWRMWYDFVRAEGVKSVISSSNNTSVGARAIVLTSAHDYHLNRTTNGWTIHMITNRRKK